MTLPNRMTLAIVTLVAATTVGILFFTNEALEHVISTRALVQIGTHARLLANKLEDRIGDVKDDVLILAPISSLEEFIRLRIHKTQNLKDDAILLPSILVDPQLPDSDAITLIKKLRGQWHYQNTPVIAVSADPKRLQGHERGSMFNALDWLIKPLDIERLVRILNRPIIRDEYPRPRILHFDGDGVVLRLSADTLKASADVYSSDTVDQARHALTERVFYHEVIGTNLAGGDFGIELSPDLHDKKHHPIPTIGYSVPNRPEIAAGVVAALAKAPTSIRFLVVTLCRYVAGRPIHAPNITEVE
jgi:CheY-like chemotaxis protein